jgi:N-acetylneuraminic acid mutarotase
MNRRPNFFNFCLLTSTIIAVPLSTAITTWSDEGTARPDRLNSDTPEGSQDSSGRDNQNPRAWETIETNGEPTARHEATMVAFQDKAYLLGGRRINPVDVFDPTTNSWTAKSKTPMELHHFQGVVVEDRIYLMGAVTGGYPRETPLEKIVVYYPNEDRFDFVHSIPESRRRGGAGAVYHDGKIYLVGGITNGHMDGCRNWFDQYDPKTGDWKILPDAPNERDHFQAVVIDGRLYAAGGRQTSKATNEVFSKTIAVVDVFDFKSGQWIPNSECPVLPTPRAGNSTASADGKLIVAGGESGNNPSAHAEVDVYDPKSQSWSSFPSLQRGRHGGGLATIDDCIYTASGSGGRGGSPELKSTERLRLRSDQ